MNKVAMYSEVIHSRLGFLNFEIPAAQKTNVIITQINLTGHRYAEFGLTMLDPNGHHPYLCLNMASSEKLSPQREKHKTQNITSINDSM